MDDTSRQPNYLLPILLIVGLLVLFYAYDVIPQNQPPKQPTATEYRNESQSIEPAGVPDDAGVPTVDLMGRSGDLNQWSRESFTIDGEQELQLRWESTDATNCDSSDFETYGSPANVQADVEEPPFGDSRTYSITCTGPGGTGSDSITVSSSGVEANVPPTNGTGSDLDLTALSPGTNVTNVPTNNIDGTYLNLPILLQIENLGPSDAPPEGIGYFASLDLDPQLGLPDLQTSVGWFSSDLSASTSSPTLTRTFPEVKFGSHQLCSEVNTVAPPSGSIFPETNTSNNVNCTNVSLPVPPPPMLLLSNQSFIRGGQSTDLEWEVNVTYELNCRVTGSTIDTTFDTPGETSGNITTGVLDNTSIFRLTCTEPVTDTNFTTETTVQVVPSYPET